jgi:predicted metal-dependent enzyme (double-stranded beta helix superfamily)
MSNLTPVRPAADAALPLPADLLAEIAAGIAQARSLWAGRVRHDQPTRHAVRLLVHDSYEVWVIGWPPEHRTTPHDHGGSVGALAVVEGELVERADDQAGASQLRSLGPGDVIALPADVVHDVGTLHAGSATSIHVYSPPLSTMTFYEDATGLPDHVLDVLDDRPVLDAETVARSLHPAGRARHA